MPTIVVAHTMGNLPPNPCFTSEQDRANAFDAAQQITLPINFTTAIVSSTSPGPDDRDKIWIQVDGAGRYIATNLFSNGSWQTNVPADPYLDIGDFRAYDPNLSSPIAPWYPCDGSVTGVPDLRGRFLIGAGQRVLPAGSLDASTNYVAGTTGGEQLHINALNEIGSHVHGPLGGGSFCLDGGSTPPPSGELSGGANLVSEQATTGAAGGNPDGTTQGHNNIPPYLVVAYKQWRPDLS
jgi:hypothetical protein